MTFDSLIDATPVPENRAKIPKEVKKINKWLGVSQNSEVLMDILEVAANIIKIHNLEDTVEGTNILKNHSLFREILKKFNYTSP